MATTVINQKSFTKYVSWAQWDIKKVMFVPADVCPHIFVVVELKCLDDLWSYAVEPLMPDRPKVRFKTRGARMVEIRFQDVRRASATEPETA